MDSIWKKIYLQIKSVLISKKIRIHCIDQDVMCSYICRSLLIETLISNMLTNQARVLLVNFPLTL